MISLRMPSARAVEKFLSTQSKLDFTYSAIGATAATPPAGYNVDHSRIKLGEGESVFFAAKTALQHWRQLGLTWVEAQSFEPSIQVGGMVAVVGRSVGFWWLNACRIVYLIEDEGTTERFGYAYGTLPAHAGTGEERFLIEWNRADNRVWYDILAFSKPHGLLAHLGYPWMRKVQGRFRAQSGEAMRRAVIEPVFKPK